MYRKSICKAKLHLKLHHISVANVLLCVLQSKVTLEVTWRGLDCSSLVSKETYCSSLVSKETYCSSLVSKETYCKLQVGCEHLAVLRVSSPSSFVIHCVLSLECVLLLEAVLSVSSHSSFVIHH